MPPYYARLDAVLRDRLHTWKLTPTQQRSRLWELCSYRGVVFVRAESCAQARQLAASAFCKEGAIAPGKLVESPWLSSGLARCEAYLDARFDAVNTAGVVDPPTGHDRQPGEPSAPIPFPSPR